MTINTRSRLQAGSIVRIGEHFYIRYSERRNLNGVIVRKRVSHRLGPIIGNAKKPPQNIVIAAQQHMATVNSNKMPAERVLTVNDFAEQVFLPWVTKHNRPSTAKGYGQAWRQHLKPYCEKAWLKDVETFDVQNWLDRLAHDTKLARNTLKRVQSVLSALFRVAKKQGYFKGVNPVQDTDVDPGAAAAVEMAAYSFHQVQELLSVLPEPGCTAFAIACFAGLRSGEIEGLRWEDIRDSEIYVTRSIWNGKPGLPKTRKSAAPVPIIRQLAQRLEMHRLRCGSPEMGPVFANSVGKPLAMNNLLRRVILPVLNGCKHCGQLKGKRHVREDHLYERNEQLPRWLGWHSARRGLGTNLYQLGVPSKVIQLILRHSNVHTTEACYILPAQDDARAAMRSFELAIPENGQSEAVATLTTTKPVPSVPSESVN